MQLSAGVRGLEKPAADDHDGLSERKRNAARGIRNSALTQRDQMA